MKLDLEKNYDSGNERVKCPVCFEWFRPDSLRIHIAAKHDQAHRDFVDQHSKIKTIKILDIEF